MLKTTKNNLLFLITFMCHDVGLTISIFDILRSQIQWNPIRDSAAQTNTTTEGPDSWGYGQGRRKELFKGGGVVLNVNFKKVFFCTDLCPNTLYRKCIKFAPKKGGSSDPPDPPFPTPLMGCPGSVV